MPAGLRRRHTTKAGVWGVIHVVEGRLRFRSLEPVEEMMLAAGTGIAVAPGQLLEVEPDGQVRFYVEFYRATARA